LAAPIRLVIGALVVVVAWARAQGTADAVAAFEKGRYAEARAALERIVVASPGDRVAPAMLALSRAATGSCGAAIPDLEKHSTSHADAALRRLTGVALVQCLLAGNRIGETWPVLQRLRAAFPNDPDVLYQAAKVHMKAWNDTVAEIYRKAPASFRVNQLSGEIFEIQGRYQEAAAEYRKAIEKNPTALNLHFRLGRALLLESHEPATLEKARAEFEAELALNPGDAVAEYQVGQILLAEGKAAEAAVRYEKAVALHPEFAEALIALAGIRSEKKQYAEAIALLEKAVKLQPANESAHYKLMLAYRNAGRGEDAAREKAVIEKLQQPAEGEFAEFLKRLGEKTPKP
jgi:tetratricopeptide (TPR) repeat protein